MEQLYRPGFFGHTFRGYYPPKGVKVCPRTQGYRTKLRWQRSERKRAERPAERPAADPPLQLRPTGRFSAQRKTQAVIRLLRGEDLETLSRQLGVTAATLSLWREDFLAAGTAALKTHPGEHDPRDDLIQRLKAKIGELTMENELLYEKGRRLDEQLPLAQRRSRR